MYFKKTVILYNKNKDSHCQAAQAVQAFLRSIGADGVLAGTYAEIDVIDPVHLLISIGGDGSTLHSARYAAQRGIPLLTINAGTLGFLSVCEMNNYQTALNDIMRGKFEVHERFLLSADIERVEKPPVRGQLAFNDCVIKAAQSRAFYLKANYKAKTVGSFFGDGMIISTPTGSTAYSLAAGGPIVEPGLDVFLLTPICPHTLTQRPIILPAEGNLIFEPRFKNNTDTAQVTLDGHHQYPVSEGDKVIISRYPSKLKIISTPGGFDFFQSLSNKLKWGKQ